MSRFLFAPMPFTGHVNPGLPIARALVARGHDVRFYSTERFRKAIEGIGARFVPFRNAMPIDEESLDLQFIDRPKDGIQQLRHDVRNLFVAAMPGMLRDLEEELTREPACSLIGDSASSVVEA